MVQVPPLSAAPAKPRAARRLPLLLVAFICIAPMIASYAAYYLFPRESRTNYGTLLAIPAPALEGVTADGRAFALSTLSGRWAVLVAAGGACDEACDRALYATRQARAMEGRERDRVVRVWLVTDGASPSAATLAAHPDVAIVRAPPDALSAWPQGAGAIYLVDPLGNVVLAWPRDPDVRKLANDLSKLLRASQIG